MTPSKSSPARVASKGRRGGRCCTVAVAILLAVSLAAPAAAGHWTFRLEAIQMEAYGHDQHVLNVHEIDPGATPAAETTTAVNLETDSGLAYRGEFQFKPGQWGLGLDAFWFNTSQDTPARSQGATGGGDRIEFEIADRTYGSTGPGEVLFYDVLEDTDLALWTVDLYGIRTLAEKPASAIHLRFGLRVGDFDNDYRAVVGVQDLVGTRLDASSNYGLMMGPLVALAGDVEWGRSRIEGLIGQSVLLGSAELSSQQSEFAGPFGPEPAVFDVRTLRKDQDVGIPITELRLEWTYRVSDHLAVGAAAHGSAWFDVPVPPGVLPIADGAESLHENTIVLFGLSVGVELTF